MWRSNHPTPHTSLLSATCHRTNVNGATTIISTTTTNSPISSAAVVEGTRCTNINNNQSHPYHCHDTGLSTNHNTIATTTLKHPTPSTVPTNNIMADIPLHHSSHTRTLLPGLRRKSSIRRPTQRSRWYTIQEQIGQHRPFSFVMSLCSSISTGNSTCDVSKSDASSASVLLSSSSSHIPLVIKPPKHTQRILKYDPITGNAYNSSNSNSNNSSHNRSFIQIAILGLFPRNKALLSIWKLTLLVSFVYINLNLFQLQHEHYQISQLFLSSISTTNNDHTHNHYHHRALRGSVRGDGSHDSEYHTDHNHNILNSVTAPVDGAALTKGWNGTTSDSSVTKGWNIPSVPLSWHHRDDTNDIFVDQHESNHGSDDTDEDDAVLTETISIATAMQ